MGVLCFEQDSLYIHRIGYISDKLYSSSTGRPNLYFPRKNENYLKAWSNYICIVTYFYSVFYFNPARLLVFLSTECRTALAAAEISALCAMLLHVSIFTSSKVKLNSRYYLPSCVLSYGIKIVYTLIQNKYNTRKIIYNYNQFSLNGFAF
jgi:hypothetical protein